MTDLNEAEHAVERMFMACADREELAQALLLALHDTGVSKSDVNALYHQALRLKGWDKP